MKINIIAPVCAAVGLALSPCSAQQALSLNVLDDYGTVSLAARALGCFDPVAALRFDADVKTGAVSSSTEQSFAVGSCLAFEGGMQINNAQRANIEDRIFVRGTVAENITAYFPEWAASLSDVDDGYSADRVAIAGPMFAAAEALQGRIEAMQQCSTDTDELNGRIADYNERVAALSADSDAPVTGSRIVGRGSSTAPTTQIFLPSAGNLELLREGRVLKKEAGSLEERCSKYRNDISLDRDYLAYYGIGA